jgi:hypothetical protein
MNLRMKYKERAMATQKLIELVKNQRVHFQYYRDKELWYKTDSDFLFPVPISDAGTATFLNEDKAILFMRYIRKYKEALDAAA